MLVMRVRSALEGEALREALDSIGAAALRPDAAPSVQEIRLAHHLAERALAKKTNVARSLRMEFLLWLTGRTDIRSAASASFPDGQDFLVVVLPERGAAPRPAEVCSRLTAKELPLGLSEEAEPLALERISLSRIGK